jgi:hypothetical protein
MNSSGIVMAGGVAISASWASLGETKRNTAERRGDVFSVDHPVQVSCAAGRRHVRLPVSMLLLLAVYYNI